LKQAKTSKQAATGRRIQLRKSHQRLKRAAGEQSAASCNIMQASSASNSVKASGKASNQPFFEGSGARPSKQQVSNELTKHLIIQTTKDPSEYWPSGQHHASKQHASNRNIQGASVKAAECPISYATKP
jgi:hypothetical protein